MGMGMCNHKIRQLVWDFDGTLFDSYPAMAYGFHKFLESKGYSDTEEEILDYLRISFSTAWKHYQIKYSLSEEDLSYVKAYQKREEENIHPYAHCRELLEKLHKEGCCHYLLTHRDTSAVELLQKYDMHRFFTQCILCDDGFPRKPDPAGLNFLIDKYDSDRTHWMIIGDRNMELQAGKAAGIRTCLYDSGAVTDRTLADCICIDYSEFKQIAGI